MQLGEGLETLAWVDVTPGMFQSPVFQEMHPRSEVETKNPDCQQYLNYYIITGILEMIMRAWIS
jgi:hypothetical protein